MEIARILEKLKESPCTWNYFGPPSEEVFAVSLTGSGAHFHSGVLYINTTDRYQYAHLYENMCILVTEPYHASRFFEIVQQLLLEDIRLTNSVLSLQKKLAEGSSANNIAAFVSDVLENPVLLLSADGTPLASKRLFFRGYDPDHRLPPECFSYAAAKQSLYAFGTGRWIGSPAPAYAVYAYLSGTGRYTSVHRRAGKQLCRYGCCLQAGRPARSIRQHSLKAGAPLSAAAAAEPAVPAAAKQAFQ